MKLRHLELIALFAACCVSQSCTNTAEIKQDNDGAYIIDYHKTSTINVDEYFDFNAMEAFQLDTQGDNPLSARLEFSIKDGYIFVYDFDNAFLARFSAQGKFLNRIGASGGAPHEYQVVSSFSVDTVSKTVEVLCQNGEFINRYSYTGEFVDRFRTPISSTSFCRTSQGNCWFYVPIDNGETTYRLHLLHPNGDVKEFLPLKTSAFGFREQNFTDNEGMMLFRETYLPTIYRLNEGTPKPFIRLKFGEGEISESDLEKVTDPGAFFDDILSKGFYTTVKLANGHNSIALQCTYLRMDGQENFAVIIDTKSLSAKKISFQKEGYKELFDNAILLGINRNGENVYTTPAIYFTDALKAQGISVSKYSINPEGNSVIFSLPLKR